MNIQCIWSLHKTTSITNNLFWLCYPYVMTYSRIYFWGKIKLDSITITLNEHGHYSPIHFFGPFFSLNKSPSSILFSRTAEKQTLKACIE